MFAPDHHTAWANTIALEKAGILHGRDVGVGNEIVMGEDGLATGELRETNAIRPVACMGVTGGREGLGVGTGGDPEHVTPEERAGDIAVIKKGLAYCASLGITSFQNMDGNLYQLEMLDEIDRTEGLPVRVRMPYHMKNFMPLSDLEEKAAVWKARFDTDTLRCNFVKLFMDGVTEGETAVFVDDYAHKPGWKGDPLFSGEAFNAVATEANRLGMPVAVHAIGDGAVRMVLDGYEASINANGRSDMRNRIEHIEVVHPTISSALPKRARSPRCSPPIRLDRQACRWNPISLTSAASAGLTPLRGRRSSMPARRSFSPPTGRSRRYRR